MKRISHLGYSFRNSLPGARKDGASEEDPQHQQQSSEDHQDSSWSSPDNDSTVSSAPTTPKAAPAPTLIGKAWKRRGGVAGKLSAKAPTAWELRNLQLVGTKLVYYSTDDMTQAEGAEEEEVTFAPESNPASPQSQTSESSANGGMGMGSWFDKAKSTAGNMTNNIGNIIHSQTTASGRSTTNPATAEPRGSLDLSEAETRVYASYGHSGAPSPFCLSFQVGLAKETKWKLAFDTLQEQMEWLAAVSTVIIQGSVDDYNGLLLRAASVQTVNQQIEGGALFVHQPSVREPPAPPETLTDLDTSANGHAGAGASSGGAHRLWMMDSYSVSYTDPYAPLTTMTKQQQAHKKELESAVADSNKSLMMLYQQSQAQVSQLQTQLKTIKAEHEAAQASLRSQAKEQKAMDVDQQDSTTITALRDVIAKLQSGHEEKLALLEDKHRKELDRQQKEFQTQLELTKDALMDETAAAQNEVNSAAELQSKIQELESQIQQLQSASENVDLEHQRQLQVQKTELDADYQAKLADEKSLLESRLQERLSESNPRLEALQAELSSLREENEKLMASLKADHDEQLAAQQAESAAQLETLQADLMSRVDSAQSEQAASLTALKEEISSLQSLNQTLSEKLEAAQAEEARLRQLMEATAPLPPSSVVEAPAIDNPQPDKDGDDDDEDEETFEDCITDE